MGILNVTPDSFSDGGRHLATEAAVDRGMELARDGAAVVDVGGESTRPGADPVPEAEELRRVLPVVEALAGAGVTVSIDTMKPGVAAAALEAGARIVNDVSGLGSADMRRVCADAGAGVVVMHMRGTPADMQEAPRYEDVVGEVAAFLASRVGRAVEAGVPEEAILVDPGIGFGKTIRHNLALLADLRAVGGSRPVLVGPSRKGFLGTITGVADPADRDRATAAVVALAVAGGASAVRVHDVRGGREAALVARAIVRGWT